MFSDLSSKLELSPVTNLDTVQNPSDNFLAKKQLGHQSKSERKGIQMKSFIAALALTLMPIAALADETVDVKITGMTCGVCTSAVEKELARLKDIDKKSISVELAGNHAVLKVKKNDEKTRAAIKAAVEKAGFTVASIDAAMVTPAAPAGGTTPASTGKSTTEPAKAN